MKVPFNRPYVTGNEFSVIQQAIDLGHISGNGNFTDKCHAFFEENYGLKKCLLTTSCTDALELASVIIKIKPGDEVIVPSFTFSSTANAFLLRNAKIIFADSSLLNPNISIKEIEPLITSKTKAIVLVHYAGVACDMDPILELAEKHNIHVIEDAAQAIDSYYKGRVLGSMGSLGAFSFHETKNIICGEGGMLTVNKKEFIEDAEIYWEKGTNRIAFKRGEIDKYRWVNLGSSFLPSDIIAAFLFAQLSSITDIQNKRKSLWNKYKDGLGMLRDKGHITVPDVPEYATNNAHMFYLLVENLQERKNLLKFLNEKGVSAVFHYLPLHNSPFGKSMGLDSDHIKNAVEYSDRIIRLPFFTAMQDVAVNHVMGCVNDYYSSK